MLIRICASCELPKETHTFTAEGPLCRTCIEAASTRIETIWIRGRKFHVCRKGVEKGRVPLPGVRTA